MRGTKKASGIYKFLQDTGLLETGTSEEIMKAKKEYWALMRKQWKQNHRDTYASYTIFFLKKELVQLQQAASVREMSVNKLIKQFCLESLTGNCFVDKRVVGKVRESLALFYSELQIKLVNHDNNNSTAQALLKSFVSTENKILSLFNF